MKQILLTFYMRKKPKWRPSCSVTWLGSHRLLQSPHRCIGRVWHTGTQKSQMNHLWAILEFGPMFYLTWRVQQEKKKSWEGGINHLYFEIWRCDMKIQIWDFLWRVGNFGKTGLPHPSGKFSGGRGAATHLDGAIAFRFPPVPTSP